MAKAAKNPDEMSFLDHLEELRWHLIRAVAAVVILACVAFTMKEFIFDTIIFGPKKMDFPTYRFFCKIGGLFGIDSEFCADSLPLPYRTELWQGCSPHISGPLFGQVSLLASRISSGKCGVL